MTSLITLAVLFTILGALASAKTLLHTFALMVDMFWQGVIWNDPIGVTISARAGLAARNGRTLGARVICTLFCNPLHCEQAIAADIARAKAALCLLAGNLKSTT